MRSAGEAVDATPRNNGLPPRLTTFASVNTARVASRAGNPGTLDAIQLPDH